MNKIIFASLIFSLFSCTEHVETTSPTIENISESIYASGIIKSKNQYQVFASVNGIIDKVFVAEGDTVQVGEPLLSLSNQTQKLNLENAKLSADFANLNANQVKLNDALSLVELAKSRMKSDSVMYSRQQSLWKQQIGSRIELEQRELAFQNSKTSYLSAQVKYDELQRQLNFTSSQSIRNLQISSKLESDFTIRSEVNGIVYSFSKVKGELVGAATPLAIIGDAYQFELEMQVDEYDIVKIKKGLTVLVALDSYKGDTYEAIVTRIKPMMNERTKTFLVYAGFIKQPAVLYPNVTFEANIVLRSRLNAMVLPREYVKNDSIVFLESGEQKVVEAGIRDYQKIEILSGINKDDKLVKPTE